ncbi:Ig-like domain-containing protein [Flavisolibacter tropicus]|uniref:Ig-like domain-containing protein n=1 Tax=Flavisolibacter tropicus TaxID=1492898 RepID=UPI000834E380|nr:Ig-like domain-containing protein [Flavisolibacter tropicus]
MRGVFTFFILFLGSIAFSQNSKVTVIPNALTTTGPGTAFNSTNVALIQSSNNQYITATDIPAGGSTVTLNLSGALNNAANTIPNSAIIAGFEVNIQAGTNIGVVNASLVQFTYEGTPIGTNQAPPSGKPFNPGQGTQIFGGPNNLFGFPPLYGEDIKDPNQGLAIQFTNSQGPAKTLNIDSISITIYYNLAPIVVNDQFGTAVITNPITGNVLANDSDPTGQVLTATVETQPGVGTLNLQANGTFTFTPPVVFFGGEVTFTYRATDNGNPTNFGIATVTLIYPEQIPPPLPVEFISFEASKADNGVQLSWKVGTEINVVRYEIERSTDGTNFKKIGSVDATQKSSYSFTDVQPVNGLAYYRVRNVDHDGAFKYTTVVKFKNDLSAALFKAFPTTTNGLVTFQHPTVVGKTLITINNLEGRTLRAITPANGSLSTQIDLSAYPSGTYFLRYQGGNGHSEAFRIIKQ